MQLPARQSHLNSQQSGASKMAENRDKDEVRIPIPGTPVVVVENCERQKTVLKSELNIEEEKELDEAIAESFPASDSPAVAQPESNCKDDKERDKKDRAA
jgi:hypothetical protein